MGILDNIIEQTYYQFFNNNFLENDKAGIFDPGYSRVILRLCKIIENTIIVWLSQNVRFKNEENSTNVYSENVKNIKNIRF